MKPFLQPQRENNASTIFYLVTWKLKFLLGRSHLVSGNLWTTIYAALLQSDYFCVLNMIFLMLWIKFKKLIFHLMCKKQLLNNFNILKVIVIINAHLLEFMVGNKLIWNFPIFGYIFISTLSKWNTVMFHYCSEFV